MKKGFTVMELLAVIVVVAVISLVTYAVVQNNIKTTKKSSFETSVKNLIDAAREYVITNYENHDFPEGGIDMANNELELKNNIFISGVVSKNEEGAIEVINLTDGEFCVNGTKNNLEITLGSCEAFDKTAPDLEVKVLKTTVNSVRFLVKMQDAQSGVKELSYCSGDCSDIKTIELPDKRSMVKKVIEVKDLKPGEEYQFHFTLVNNYPGDEKITTTKKDYEVTTPVIEEPIFKLSSGSYATTKVVQIQYPEVEGYKYSYVINNGEETVLESGKYKTSFEISDDTLIKAIVSDEENELVSSELYVTGLDNTPPTTYVYIENKDTWTLEKKVYVKSTDDKAGIALRAYSLDDKKSWQKIKNDGTLLTLRANQTFTLKTRDKIGNIQEDFLLCEDRNFKNCQQKKEFRVSLIDNVSPSLSVNVLRQPGDKANESNPWYISKTVIIQIRAYDRVAEYANGQTTIVNGGIGIGNIYLKSNGSTISLGNPYSGSLGSNYVEYRVTLTANNVYNLSYGASDKLGNSTSGSMTIQKDDVVPDIECGNDSYIIGTTPISIIRPIVGISKTKEYKCDLTAIYPNNNSSNCYIINNAGVRTNKVCTWKIKYPKENLSFSPSDAKKCAGGSDDDYYSAKLILTSEKTDMRGATEAHVSFTYKTSGGHIGSKTSGQTVGARLYDGSGSLIKESPTAKVHGSGTYEYVFSLINVDYSRLVNAYIELYHNGTYYRACLRILDPVGKLKHDEPKFEFMPASEYLYKGGSDDDYTTLKPAIESTQTNLNGKTKVTAKFNLYKGNMNNIGSGISKIQAYGTLRASNGTILRQTETFMGEGDHTAEFDLSGLSSSDLQAAYVVIQASATCYRSGIGVKAISLSAT